MHYTRFNYIYPPRPEKKIAPTSLFVFDNGKFLGQPKLNGSSFQVYTNGKLVITMNRHKENMSHKLDIEELRKLHRGKGWMVLCGEYMNKNKKDENENPWNIKYVIFDILVYNGHHLLKSTYEERQDLLEELYPVNPIKKYLHKISNNCYRVRSIKTEFKKVYDDITRYDMYEGLVMKLASGKLENGTTKNNNTGTQFKCRKSTKNYPF